MTDNSEQKTNKNNPEDKQVRVPPGQLLTSRFPVLHYGPIPPFNPATWEFRTWGEVEQPLVLTWDQFLELPRVSLTMDLHCVTTWSKLDTHWEGVRVSTLLEMGLIKLKPNVRYVMQHAEFGFTANLPLEIVLAENFILATHYDGKLLTPEHGAPLRGLIGAFPDRQDLKDVYLWKGAKWLRSLEFMTGDRRGFWESAGYHNEGDVWLEQRTS